MFSNVDHGVGFEDIPDPAIVGDVMMGRSQVRAVVDGDGMFAESPGRLQADKDVTQVDARYGQASVGAVNLSRRLTPSLGHLLDNLGWKSLKPFGVLAAGDVTDRHFKLLFGKRVPVVAAPFDYAVDQLISGFGYIGDVITGAFHGIQNADHRCRCIQTHRVADTGVLGGIVA